jgi:hypothetical protein
MLRKLKLSRGLIFDFFFVFVYSGTAFPIVPGLTINGYQNQFTAIRGAYQVVGGEQGTGMRTSSSLLVFFFS